MMVLLLVVLKEHSLLADEYQKSLMLRPLIGTV